LQLPANPVSEKRGASEVGIRHETARDLTGV